MSEETPLVSRQVDGDETDSLLPLTSGRSIESSSSTSAAGAAAAARYQHKRMMTNVSTASSDLSSPDNSSASAFSSAHHIQAANASTAASSSLSSSNPQVNHQNQQKSSLGQATLNGSTSTHSIPASSSTNSLSRSPQPSRIRIEQYQPHQRQPTITSLTPTHTLHTFASLSDNYMNADYRAVHSAVASRNATSTESSSQQRAQALNIQLAIYLSLVVNVLLFVAKTYTAISSRSLAVAASAVDSFLDLLSQIIVTVAERGTRSNTDRQLYPTGKSRLEPIGVILCAAIMSMASLQLISESAEVLIDGFIHKDVKVTVFDQPTIILLWLTIISKIVLYWFCSKMSAISETVMTLAVDHRNDVLSNAVAVAAALCTVQFPYLWYVDPLGAIAMSLYIALNWFGIGREQIDRLIGRSADESFISEIRQLASNHHALLRPDIIRAYHFGARFLVELEVVLPHDMTVREAHDISLALQQTVEQMTDVERAFVHVDYEFRCVDEHDKEEVALQRRLSLQRPLRIQTDSATNTAPLATNSTTTTSQSQNASSSIPNSATDYQSHHSGKHSKRSSIIDKAVAATIGSSAGGTSTSHHMKYDSINSSPMSS